MTATCDWVRARLTRFADGELPAAEAERVREHLARCAACAARQATLAATDALAGTVAGEARPEDEAAFDALLARFQNEHDLAAAERRRREEQALEHEHRAGQEGRAAPPAPATSADDAPPTPEAIAAAPLEADLYRRTDEAGDAQPAGRAPRRRRRLTILPWRWIGIAGTAAAAALVTIAVLSRDPELPHRALAPELDIAPPAAREAADDTPPAAPDPEALETAGQAAPRARGKSEARASGAETLDRAAVPEAPAARTEAVARVEAAAPTAESPASDAWPLLERIAGHADPAADGEAPAALRAMLTEAEAQLVRWSQANERGAAAVARARLASPRTHLVLADAWYRLARARPEAPARLDAFSLAGDSTAAGRAAAAYRRALAADDDARGEDAPPGVVPLSPRLRAHVERRIAALTGDE